MGKEDSAVLGGDMVLALGFCKRDEKGEGMDKRCGELEVTSVEWRIEVNTLGRDCIGSEIR